MIRVAVCGNIAFEDGGDAKAVIEQCARDCGTFAQVVEHESPFALIDSVARANAEDVVDIVVCASDLPGMTGVEVARELGAIDGNVPVVLHADSAEGAYDAMVAHARGYLVNPFTKAEFTNVLKARFDDIIHFQDQSAVLRCRDRVRRVPYSDFVFAETLNHNQLVHAVGGAKYEMRATSAMLFEQLARDPRFFKAGSSCIINLDHVRAVRSGGSVVSLDNGYTCSVPVRLRKSFEQAIMHKRS